MASGEMSEDEFIAFNEQYLTVMLPHLKDGFAWTGAGASGLDAAFPGSSPILSKPAAAMAGICAVGGSTEISRQLINGHWSSGFNSGV